MSKTVSLFAATLAALWFCQSPAQALISRAWVSGHGVDAAGCGSPASPCRSFQYVHDNVIAAGGEIDVLDPAGYGAITITKSLSIVNDGVGTAGVQAASGTAIAINAGSSDSVSLRGLNIDGLGTAANGVAFNSGGGLNIVNCVIRHFQEGVVIQPLTGTTGFLISNVIASDNAAVGVQFLPPGGGTINGVIDRLTVTQIPRAGGDGVFVHSIAVGGAYNLVISNSNLSNYNTGINIQAGVDLQVSIDNSTLSGNQYGLYASGENHILLGRSVITGNAQYGVWNGTSGNTLYTYGNNQINSNGTDVHGGLNPAATLQ